MKLRIDKAGRIVLPKPLRERLRFKPETGIEVTEQPEGVFLKRAQEAPSMSKVDGLWVHHGKPEAGADWDRIVEDTRDERIACVFNV
jgi:AbrB family looped-hinge helix DNA binding protein